MPFVISKKAANSFAAIVQRGIPIPFGMHLSTSVKMLYRDKGIVAAMKVDGDSHLKPAIRTV